MLGELFLGKNVAIGTLLTLGWIGAFIIILGTIFWWVG